MSKLDIGIPLIFLGLAVAFGLGVWQMLDADDKRTDKWAHQIASEHQSTVVECIGNVFGDPDCTADGYPIKPEFR